MRGPFSSKEFIDLQAKTLKSDLRSDPRSLVGPCCQFAALAAACGVLATDVGIPRPAGPGRNRLRMHDLPRIGAACDRLAGGQVRRLQVELSNPMSNVHEVNDPKDLALLRRHWRKLLSQTPGATFFHSLDWLEAYCRHFGDQVRLRILVVIRGAQPIGILPLVVRTRTRFATIRVLTYPLDGWGCTYGPIGPNPMATLAAGLAHVRGTPRNWDLVELPWVDVAGIDEGRTAAALEVAGLSTQVEPWETGAVVDLASYGTWDAYWASRRSRWRNNVRRAEKKLRQRGHVSYLRYRPAGAAAGDANPRWKLYDACEEIARASWQGASQSGTTLTHEQVRPFLRDCHEVAAQAGALDVNVLFVDEEPVAFNYAYHYQGSVFGLRTGFNLGAASEGAGTVLQMRMIEDSFARGDRFYDLGADYLDCKRYWQTRTRTTYRYTHFAKSAPAAQLARVKRELRRLIGPLRKRKKSTVESAA
jgi:CelD/BcsL family acetyltransferase involved in cellulose biosynthesis